jgi:BolA family transcriptional regulator, general stress-responsive regulator
MKSPRAERIKATLESAFTRARVTVHDDSARHAGHPGAREGAGHFLVRVESQDFAGRGRVERHRLVYEALAAMLPREIHALNIEAVSPDDENTSRNK